MIKAIGQYKQIGLETALTNASPHRLIQMLYEGALQNLVEAKGCIQHNQPELLTNYIKKVSNILVGLEEGLDLDKGGEIALNLKRIYQFLQTELIVVQSEQSITKLNKLIDIVTELKSGWDLISPNS